MHLNWKRVSLHALTVFALSLVAGFGMGLVGGVMKTPVPMLWLALCNLVFASAGFAYAAYTTHDKRWAHLAAVALVLWLLSMVTPIFGLATWLEWLFSAVPVLIFMIVGGGAATLFEKFRSR